MPLSSAILPALRGSPASIIVANTFAFVSIFFSFISYPLFDTANIVTNIVTTKKLPTEIIIWL
jgi:hypothetical protein